SAGRITFLADLDGWPHLYSISENGGAPLLLTPGNFMVEYVAPSPDRTYLVYNANTGARSDDVDRRHIFTVLVDRAQPVTRTPGGRGAKAGRRLRTRWAAAADAPRLALHGLLHEFVCDESVPRQHRLRGASGELSPRHRLRTRLSPSGARRCVRRVGVSGREGWRPLSSLAARGGPEAHRHLGRLVRRLPHR